MQAVSEIDKLMSCSSIYMCISNNKKDIMVKLCKRRMHSTVQGRI
jgi:hypothetical protein